MTDQILAIPSHSGRRHIAVAAACFSMLVFGVSATILPATLVIASAEFRVSEETLGMVISTQFAAFFLATLVGGVLSDRIGKKPVLLTMGCAALILGSLIWSVTPRPFVAHVAAVFLGMGGGVLESMGSALLADLYPERKKFVLNVSQVAYCVGAVGGPAVMAVLLPLNISWRMFFVAEAALGAILFILYCISPMPRSSCSNEAGIGDSVRLICKPAVYLPALGLFCYVLAETGVAAFANLYLYKDHHAPEEWAILGISLVWGAMMIGRLICVFLPEGIHTGRLIAVLAILSAAALAAQIFAKSWLLSFAIFGLTGFALSGIWPLIVALSAASHPQRTGSVVGIVVATGALGVVAAPVLVSAMRQAGLGVYVFPLLAGAMLIAAAACGLPRNEVLKLTSD